MAVLDIEAIKARCDKATPGPWEHYRGKLRPQFGTRINEVRSCDDSCAVVAWPGFDDSARDEKEHAANAKFIAHARTDEPALLARVAELEAAQEWQPISTAPKTGEHILALTGGSFGICGGKKQAWMDVVHYWNVPGEEGFYPSNGPDEPYTRLTHWMPLPSLPEREQRRL